MCISYGVYLLHPSVFLSAWARFPTLVECMAWFGADLGDTTPGQCALMCAMHSHGCDFFSLLWRHNGRDCVSNHQPHDCLLNRLFRRRSKQTSKLRVTGLCAGNSPGTGEFSAQMASNAENVSIWWRHHVCICVFFCIYCTLYYIALFICRTIALG